MLIFFVRHGLTDWNAQRRFQGTCDIPLNAQGLSQAEAVAARCAQLHIQRIYHSTLTRAVQTAQAVARATGAPLSPLPGFNEICMGGFQGLTHEQAVQRFPQESAAYFADLAHAAPPDGESMPQLQARALCALSQAVKSAGELDRIAIVSHGALLKALFCAIMDAPLASFSRFDVSNCSLSIAETSPEGLRMVTLNDVSHFGPYGSIPANRLMI